MYYNYYTANFKIYITKQKGSQKMKLEKKLYSEAKLEVVLMDCADIVTNSSILDTGTDPDKDAGFGNVPGGDDSWDA